MLTEQARTLRKNMTECEQILWRHIRYQQIQGIQFYRQRVLGCYIVDFYAPSIRLVIEVDGVQHNEKEQQIQDQNRDNYLSSVNITVFRVSNFDIRKNLYQVLEVLKKSIESQLR